MKTKLRQNWRALFSSNSPESDAVFDDLIRRYSEPTRFYHTLSHLENLFGVIESLRPHVSPAVRVAVFFHDAIYDSRASDNEEKSAELAEKALGNLDVSKKTIEKTTALIRATKTHDAGGDDAANVLLDADLSILGASETEYDAYAQNVRQEYAWVEDSAWKTGRSRVLESFMTRETIYQTREMRQKYEAAARANLTRERANLTDVLQ